MEEKKRKPEEEEEKDGRISKKQKRVEEEEEDGSICHDLMTKIISNLGQSVSPLSMSKLQMVSQFWNREILQLPKLIHVSPSVLSVFFYFNFQEYLQVDIKFKKISKLYTETDKSTVKDLMLEVTQKNPLDFPYTDLTCTYVQLVGANFGLVCLMISDEDIKVWNPYTRQNKTISSSVSNTSTFRKQSPSSESRNGYGFAYKYDIKDYMVVELATTWNDAVQVSSYLLGDGLWRTHQVSKFFFFLKCEYQAGMTMDHRIYWIGSIDYQNTIVSWDVRKERLREVPTQGSEVGKILQMKVIGCDVTLGTMQGKLAVVFSKCDDHTVVWLMASTKSVNSWQKCFKVVKDQIWQFPSFGFLRMVKSFGNGLVLPCSLSSGALEEHRFFCPTCNHLYSQLRAPD